jgi:hypothetical protein
MSPFSLRHHPVRRPLALILLLALTVPLPAVAKDVRVAGVGVRQCSEWLQWKEAKNGEARALVLEWAHGFIAGHNVYARSGGEPANSVVADAKVLAPLLDSYCQRNPQSRILGGVVEITQSLGGAKVNVAPKAPAPQNPRPDTKIERES